MLLMTAPSAASHDARETCGNGISASLILLTKTRGARVEMVTDAYPQQPASKIAYAHCALSIIVNMLSSAVRWI
jgi:hypothetical protein